MVLHTLAFVRPLPSKVLHCMLFAFRKITTETYFEWWFDV